MEFYSRLLFQISEAKRYIDDGRIEHLRLALLLLDNAAEMHLAEYIKTELVHEKWSERMKEMWEPMAHLDGLPESARESLAFKALTRNERRQIAHSFEEKINYAARRKGALAQHFAGPLLHLHKYRNEAYHRNQVRSETIRAACLILLEIVCEMVLQMPRDRMSSSSDEDYSWLKEQFGLTRKNFHSAWLPSAIAKIRAATLPDSAELSFNLETYFTDRLTSFHSNLEFLVENLSSVNSKEEALAATFQFRLDSIEYAGNEVPQKSLQPRTLDWLNELRANVGEIAKAPTRVESFQKFAELEAEFEPIETALIEFSLEIDHYIELQADIEREISWPS